ncbi:fibronectin type III domain-containing protein [Micromonospora krabiensis]|uniref:Fibronectin type III domain-containing protein n=1 Tax=Micromonospora krabiensis TaxID=307121 RepID=A0A1C3N5S8_9ACTN|nr:fibronectin type III domain-containing protein [Micromonospora krabiensis]SBV27935.1 Fibronectin type III domain-containing protein [Micromonospora krabiensis]
MATSGTVRPKSNGIYVTWSLASQSVANNTSTVNVTFGWGFHSSPLDRQLDNGTCQVNGVTVYQNTGRIKNYTGDLRDRDHAVWSGTRTISHDSAGNANISLYGIMTGYEGDRVSGSDTWALPQIPRLASSPGTPSVSGHTDSDPTTATISWSTPSNVGAGLERRQLLVADRSDFYNLNGPYVINDISTWGTSYSATGLPKGKTLYAMVRAINDAGYGPWSGTATFTVGTTAPSAPGTPAASGITGSSMTISWGAPGDNGGASISGYELQRADDPSFATGLVTTSLPSGSTSLQVTGLKHTWRYHYRVRATNTAGKTSGWSGSASFETTATAPTAPAAPVVTDRMATGLGVLWGAPADNGGATVTGYDVQWSTSSSFSSASTISTTSPLNQVLRSFDALSDWFTNSTEGAVTASTAQSHGDGSSILLTPDGVGTQAAARSIAVMAVSPGDPLRGSAWVRCSVARSVRLRIDWRDSSGVFLSTSGVNVDVPANTWTYLEIDLTAPAGAAGAGVTVMMLSTPPSSHLLWIDEARLYGVRAIDGLSPSTDYYVRVRAKNAVGAGAWSSALAARTTSGLRVSDAAGTVWREADVWVAVPVPGGYEWRRCQVQAF